MSHQERKHHEVLQYQLQVDALKAELAEAQADKDEDSDKDTVT